MQPFQIAKGFYVRFTFLKKQYRFTLKTTSAKTANQICEQIERGLDKGIFDSFEEGTEGRKILELITARPGLRAEEAQRELVASTTRMAFKMAIDSYLENCKTEHAPRNYINEVRTFQRFSEFVTVSHLHLITPDVIERWRNSRAEQVSKPTVNRELKMVKRFFRQSVEKGYIVKSPADTLKPYKEPERAIRHLSDDEVKRLLECAPEDLRKVITFLLLTGMRYGELCHLHWADIDFRRKQIIVQPKIDWNPKNFKKRIIPMHPMVLEILNTISRHDDIIYVFPGEGGLCAEGGLRNRIYRIFESAKVDGNVKDLRSTFASNAVMSGLPIYTVSKLLGHHDVKITEKHYAHLAPDYMGNAIVTLQCKWLQGI